MKKLSKLLQKGNLSPRERIMAVIKNDIHKEKNGTTVLSETDLHALSEGWQPKDNYEAKEYNKYWNAWDTFVKLGMDMQMLFYTALLDLAEIEKALILYYFNDNRSKMRLVFDKQSTDEQIINMRNYVLDNTGIEYKTLIHRHTFHKLPKSLQNDMIALHPEAENDSSYFDEEEQLATILKGKKNITEEEIDELTEMIVQGIQWNRRATFEEKGLNFMGTIFHAYFAGYPLMNFGKKLADIHDIDYENEDDMIQKLGKIKNLKNEFTYAVHDAVADGLFFDEYTPLCNSQTYITYSGKTKLKHNLIISRWLKAKQKTIDEIQEYIDNNTLVVEDRTQILFDIPVIKTIITGGSLCHADESLLFVQEYKEQVEIMMDYGYLFEIRRVRDINEKYGQLLKYKEYADKISKIVEEDATHSAQRYLDEIQKTVDQMNLYIYGLEDQISNALFLKNDFTFYSERFFDDFKLCLDNIKPTSHISLDIFEERVKKFLNSEWK